MAATLTPTRPPSRSASGPLSLDEVVAVARHDARVELTTEALDRDGARAAPPSTRSPTTSAAHYGVSTGFGALATRHIPLERRASSSAA